MSKSFSNEAIPALSVCESPIEGRLIQAMFDEWSFAGYDQWDSDLMAHSRMRLTFHCGDENSSDWYYLKIAMQASLADVPHRRLDFLVLPLMASPFALELDGFEHHSSKQSFCEDRAKDRGLVRLGVNTLRFGGPEVYADASACLGEIIEVCRNLDDIEQTESGQSWERGVQYAARNPLRALEIARIH